LDDFANKNAVVFKQKLDGAVFEMVVLPKTRPADLVALQFAARNCKKEVVFVTDCNAKRPEIGTTSIDSYVFHSTQLKHCMQVSKVAATRSNHRLCWRQDVQIQPVWLFFAYQN
jgi:hypothetical protein